MKTSAAKYDRCPTGKMSEMWKASRICNSFGKRPNPISATSPEYQDSGYLHRVLSERKKAIEYEQTVNWGFGNNECVFAQEIGYVAKPACA